MQKVLINVNNIYYSINSPDNSILELPHTSTTITGNEFIEYGMDKPIELDMSQTFNKKKYLVNESETLGNGKVFKKTIDVSKVPIKSVEIED